MLELSANIEFIFGDRDFVDRIDGVAETGIGAFEFGAWTELDVPEIAERARRFGLKVTNISVDPKVECLNTLVDHADYFIASWQEGIGIVREVDSPAVGLTFDAYHHQVNEGNLISSLTGDIDLVRHIHIADVPGRHEPGSGEINYLNLLTAAKQAGYDGYLGLECVPTKSDVAAALAPIRQIVDQVNRADS